jgi:hypothetical protein
MTAPAEAPRCLQCHAVIAPGMPDFCGPGCETAWHDARDAEHEARMVERDEEERAMGAGPEEMPWDDFSGFEEGRP